MALERSTLKAMGLNDDQIASVIAGHSETVNALKNERDDWKKKAEAAAAVQTQLDAANKQLADLKKEDWKKKYDDEHAAFEKYKAEVTQKETDVAKRAALQEIAKDAGLSESGIAKAVKYTDLSTVELDDKGQVKGKAALLKSIKEEWADYVKQDGVDGADTTTPPATGGKTYKTVDEIWAIADPVEQQRAIAENISLFG